MLVSMLLVGVLACGGGETTPTPAIGGGGNTVEAKASGDARCTKCIESGGTWQPHANKCTEDCNIMDISCFRDACPAECAVDNCGHCLGKGDCEKVGCTWEQQAEIAWCK